LDSNSNGYDYDILKEQIFHAITLMALANKKYNHEDYEKLTPQQKEEFLEQYKRILNLAPEMEFLLKTGKKCSLESIGEILELPTTENSYDLGKMLKKMQKLYGL